MIGPSYCTICAAAILRPFPGEVVQWPYTAVLLHEEAKPLPNGHILELPTRNISGDMFEVHEVAERVFAFSSITPYQRAHRPLYIPCHSQCLYIAKRAISSRRADPLRHLWLVLRSRVETARRHINQWPDRRFDPFEGWFNETMRSQRKLTDKDVGERGMYIADPLAIPDLTASICKHLEEISLADLMPADQIDRHPHLPQEIERLIWQHLCPLSNPPLECTRLVPPEQWHYSLRDLEILPWLWDIDTNVLDIKEQTRSVDKYWDWESLVRRLAIRDAYTLEQCCDGGAGSEVQFKVTKSIEGLSPGVRNRRRIWDLAIDMLNELTVDEV